MCDPVFPITTFRSPAENQRVYDLIWSQMPQMQNRNSSTWWFVLLFPRDGEVYGRRQLMFSIATRVGRRIRINNVSLPGLDLKRPVVGGVDHFPAIAVGWYFDGRRVHEDFVKQTAATTLSLPERSIRCWHEGASSGGQGIDLRSASNRALALEFRIAGRNSAAAFTAWGDLDAFHSSPHEALNIATPLGGVHFVAWRRMHFAGEFELPGGRESLDGICYFQRVCLNVPAFPWKWIWSVFPDGSIFSAYIPYVGLNLFRRGYQYFDSNRKEQAFVDIAAKGFWDWPGSAHEIVFDKARITPVLKEGPHADFMVQVSNKQGDFLSFLAVAAGQTRCSLERPVSGGRFQTHWNYNEFMFRMEQLAGRVSGQPITRETMGQAYGSLEYTYGLGL